MLGGALVVALAAVAGLAARTPALSKSHHSAVGTFPTAVVETATLLVVLIAVAGLILLVWGVVNGSGSRRRQVQKTSLLGSVLGSLTAVVLAGVFLLVIAHLHLHHIHAIPARAGTGTRRLDLHGPGVGYHFEWTPLGVVVGAVLVGLGFAVYQLRRNRPQPQLDGEPGSPSAATVAGVVGASLDELLAEPDPRRAVIAAYATMEAGLAGAGLPRRPSEAPRQFVARALLGLEIPGADVHRLTGLFEVARYSSHPVDEDMRRAAVGALRAILGHLAPLRAGAAA